MKLKKCKHFKVALTKKQFSWLELFVWIGLILSLRWLAKD